MLMKTGVATAQDLAEIAPAPERLSLGPVAVIECFQRIPCNPCYTACKTGAILPFADINDRPLLDPERCNGCAQCVRKCPGLAIFIVDETYGEQEALVKLPYEFLPLPKAGDEVLALDREGKAVATGRIVRVQKRRDPSDITVVWVAVPKGMGMIVRNIKVNQEAQA